MSSVTGHVLFDGQPVAGGQVSFVAKAGEVKTANIESDGSYKVDDVPLGEAIVLVFGPPPSSAAPPARSGMAKKLAAAPNPPPTASKGPTLPAKYGDEATSDLRYTVTSGPNSYDPPIK